MQGFGGAVGLAALAALLIAAPATAAVPTGTYTAKLKSGAGFSFKISKKGKRAGSLRIAGDVPWKCQDPEYDPSYGTPGNGPFTLGAFYTNDMKTWVPVTSKGKFDGHDRDYTNPTPKGWQIGGEIHGKATSEGKASGTVAFTGRKTFTVEYEPGNTDDVSVQCVTLGLKFSAKKK